MSEGGRDMESASFLDVTETVISGSCHHGMARPQVADTETASDMKGSCGYVE